MMRAIMPMDMMGHCFFSVHGSLVHVFIVFVEIAEIFLGVALRLVSHFLKPLFSTDIYIPIKIVFPL